MIQVLCDKCKEIIEKDSMTGTRDTGKLILLLQREDYKGDFQKLKEYSLDLCPKHASEVLSFLENFLKDTSQESST